MRPRKPFAPFRGASKTQFGRGEVRAFAKRATRLEGEHTPPGDKSISHRSLIFSALAEGTCRVTNLAPGGDVRSTAGCLRRLGVKIEDVDGATIVHGVGLKGL